MAQTGKGPLYYYIGRYLTISLYNFQALKDIFIFLLVLNNRLLNTGHRVNLRLIQHASGYARIKLSVFNRY